MRSAKENNAGKSNMAERRLIAEIFHQRTPEEILEKDMAGQSSEAVKLFQQVVIIDVCTAVMDNAPVPIGRITSDAEEKRRYYAYAADTLEAIADDFDGWFAEADKDNPFTENPFLDSMKEDIIGLIYSRRCCDKDQLYRLGSSLIKEELQALAIYMRDIDKYDWFLETQVN